jgi:hypothetical protein
VCRCSLRAEGDTIEGTCSRDPDATPAPVKSEVKRDYVVAILLPNTHKVVKSGSDTALPGGGGGGGGNKNSPS